MPTQTKPPTWGPSTLMLAMLGAYHPNTLSTSIVCAQWLTTIVRPQWVCVQGALFRAQGVFSGAKVLCLGLTTQCIFYSPWPHIMAHHHRQSTIGMAQGVLFCAPGCTPHIILIQSVLGLEILEQVCVCVCVCVCACACACACVRAGGRAGVRA